MKTYEAMFLLEPVLVTEWPVAEAEIHRILDRAGAKVLGIKNWGERKLAYPIGHRKRGLYALSYFESLPDKIGGIERDVQLSEKAVRVLVLRRDGMTPEEIEKALATEPPVRIPLRGEEPEGRPRAYRPPDREAERPTAVAPMAKTIPAEEAPLGESVEEVATFDPDAVEEIGPEEAPGGYDGGK